MGSPRQDITLEQRIEIALASLLAARSSLGTGQLVRRRQRLPLGFYDVELVYGAVGPSGVCSRSLAGVIRFMW